MDVDAIIHKTGLAIGGAVLGLGFVALFLTDFGTSLPVSLYIAQFAAVVGMVIAGFTVRNRYNASLRNILIPEVEYPLATPAPGDDLDDMLYRLTELRESTIEYRDQIREQVGEVAIAVIRQREECSREEAIERLKSGSWTDSTTAANFFVEGGVEESQSLSTQIQRRLFGTKSAFERQLEETVSALEEHAAFIEDLPEVDDEDAEQRALRSNALVDPDEGKWITDTVRYRSLLRTHLWSGVTAFALLAVAVGAFSAQPAVLLSSVVALGIAGYSRVTSAPDLAALDVERTLEDSSPKPGDEVEVQVEVTNTGNTFLTDLRLADRVPPTMRVVEGSPRLGTALRPGQSAHFEYTVVADRGQHTWPLQVVGRDISGASEREAYIDADAEMECAPRLKTAIETPVRMQTSMYSGQVSTDIGGGGLEFHSIRDYQPGDPMRRINWKQFARTGEFSTIDMREERAAKVVLMFDARESAYVSPAPGQRHALDRSVEASYDVFASLIDAGHLVGFAAFDTVPMWMGPNTGDQHMERARRMFVDHPAISPLPPDVLDKTGGYVDPMTHVRRQLPKNTQIFLFSPLTEDFVYEVARRLDGAGHLVTIISPDPTSSRTLGQRLARLERKSRVVRLREHGIRVIDWGPDNSLQLELEHATRRW
ncbi:MAG: DUF58 domain-containing protein [Halobacteriaceae archaeon]